MPKTNSLMIEAVKRLRFEKEKQRRECALTYKISRSKRYNACSDVAKSRNFDRNRVRGCNFDFEGVQFLI